MRTIESLNATVVLQKRGRSEVRHVDQIIALDNKFQPYNFQTHAGEMKCNVLYCNVHYIMSIIMMCVFLYRYSLRDPQWGEH